MPRQLPEDPRKRRLAIFRRVYQSYFQWRELIETGAASDIITTPDGEEVYFGDLLVGIDDLPPRQRQAFELIGLQGYTETAAAKVMLPNARYSTTVQQHFNAALERMVARYDEQQSGVRPLIMKVRGLMTLHPILNKHLSEAATSARREIQDQINELKAALAQIDQIFKAPKDSGSAVQQQADGEGQG